VFVPQSYNPIIIFWKFTIFSKFYRFEISLINPICRSKDGKYPEDYNWVVALWNKHSNPTHLAKYSINKIVAIRNDNLQLPWVRLHSTLKLQLKGTAFKPSWPQSTDKDLIDLKYQILERSKRFAISTEEGVSIIPMWHGTQNNPETINSICSTGFANLATTDNGYFGNGIYGTPQAEYSARVYGRGVCFLCFAFIGNLFPVLEGDMKDLIGKSNKGNSDTHYAPVVPQSKNPQEHVYLAISPNQSPTTDPVYDEFVIFQRAHIVPRYVVYYNTKK